MALKVSPFVVLAAGVLVASSSSILIRYAQGAGVPSLVIGAWRMVIASAVVTPWMLARARSDLMSISARDLVVGAASGLFLALHFALWISSLEYTSVASSAALVTTNPVWVALASVLLLREQLRVGAIVGIIVTMLGSAAIVIADANAPNAAYANPLLGNLFALGGAIAVSGYFLTGRGLRMRVSLLVYIWIAYTVAAFALTAAVLISGRSMSLISGTGLIAVAGLAFGPQLLGHTAFNWSLRRLSATFVALAILGEPIGSAVFAFALFGERIGPVQGAGFITVIVGIAIAARAERAASPPAQRVDPSRR